MGDAFQQNGLSADQAAQLSDEIQSSATSTQVMSSFSMPLPSGLPVNEVMQEAVATGLHVNAVLGALLSVLCVVLIQWSARTPRTQPAVADRR
jgi:homoserine dehydrogenase